MVAAVLAAGGHATVVTTAASQNPLAHNFCQ
jgi:hypothetical protein